MVSKSLKRSYSKLTKYKDKTNSLEVEFIKQFRKEVSYDKIKSLMETIESRGTDDDKIKYRGCCERYNKGELTPYDYELHIYYEELYGEYTKENSIRSGIINGMAMGD